jgi:hypothetical protein
MRRSAKSDVRERPPVAGGGGTGAEMVGREAALEKGAGVGSAMREWTSGGSTVFLERARSAARLRGKKERRGGVWSWGCHTARRCSDSGVRALTWVGPGGSASGEGAERCEWRAGARGLAREEKGVVEPG